MVTGGLILAAGAGSRLGRPKAELVVRGRRLIDSAADLLRTAGCSPVVAVVRTIDVTADGVRSVVNPAADEGMGSSLRTGLAAIAADDLVDCCVIVLVDQFGIVPADIDAVRSAFDGAADVVVMRRGGHRSHPVLVGRRAFAEVAGAAVGDQGARGFIDAHPERVRFVDGPDVVHDIDTAADLQRWG